MPTVGRLALQYVAEQQRLGHLTGESPRTVRYRLSLFVDHIGHDTDVHRITQRRIERWLLDMDVADSTRRVGVGASAQAAGAACGECAEVGGGSVTGTHNDRDGTPTPASGLTFGSLFAGIGGFDLGLERAGWTCRWQVELDDRKRDVLARHWPAAERFGDIAEVAATDLEPVDLICGGFPCQDITPAGRRAGIEGEHSGLWAHFARLVGDLRPRYVLVENSTSLLVRGMGRVLGDLAASGYDTEWDCIPAAAVGAAHLRARTWILAYPSGERAAADDTVFAGRPIPDLRARWAAEPDVDRVADGVPGGLDRVGWLGDAVVPQVVEYIGRLLATASAPALVGAHIQHGDAEADRG